METNKKYLIVGLGNPGKEYQENRHNIGFTLLDTLGDKYNVEFKSDKKMSSCEILFEEKKIILLKPLEYMNLSGNVVSQTLAKQKIHINQMLVLHDEIDIEFGDIRMKFGGGHAGHNGLRNIIDRTGSKDFHRLRFGVGRPKHPEFSVADFVLSNFTKEEKEKLKELCSKAVTKTENWLKSLL